MIIDFIYHNFNHFMFFLLLISRLGDVISTLIATPTLKLETNIIARKLGKKYIFLTLLVSLMAYFNTSFAVGILIPSLMVSASNIGKIWLLKNYGENNYYDLLLNLIKKNGIKNFIIYNVLSSIFIILIGLIIYILYPQPEDWGFWIASGFFIYGFVIIFWGVLNAITLNRKAKRIEN